MANGDISKANEIKKMDATREFWQYFDYWRENQKKQLEQMKNNKH